MLKKINIDLEEADRSKLFALNGAHMDEIAPNSHKIPELLSENELNSLNSSLNEVTWLPVSITGMKGNYTPGDRIDSYRVSCFDPQFAEALWERIKLVIDTDRVLDERANTDWDGTEKWRAVGINPLMRYIRYEDNGMLIPHYDAPYVQDDKTRTLQTLVIYLDEKNIDGGRTRFLHDAQQFKNFDLRNHEDWTYAASEEDIRLSITPEKGAGLIFDHRLLHDSEPTNGPGYKTILRTDITFEKI